MGRGLQLPSGRVIGLGRLLLAALFLLAMSVELGNPNEAPFQAVVLAGGYLFFSAAILVATWNDWWADARLAGPAHALDIGMFILLVLLSQGYTSPFFTFFVFLLLAPAIRWGWRATALTAALVTVLYLAVGLLDVQGRSTFDLQRFVIRTGHLIIFSLILIWFGVNQWRTRSAARNEVLLERSSPAESAVEGALRAAIAAVRATSGVFVWQAQGADTAIVSAVGRDATAPASEQPVLLDAAPNSPFLYDMGHGRALRRDAHRNLKAFDAKAALDGQTAAALNLGEGLAIPVRTEGGEGALFVEGVRSLSTDYLDLGEQIAAEAAGHMQRDLLLRAAADNAAARSRLGLARDLHDSVVQFLAGAAFRLEAMRRADASGANIGPELDELKSLLLHEQGELRSFVAALRGGSLIALSDLARDLKVLAERLSKQWSVECEFSAEDGSMMIPTRLHLDAQQLVREAVANAVRHAGAKSVSVRLAAADDRVRLDFINDGAPYPRSRDGGRMPRSLRERVEEAGGVLELSRGMGVTRLSIALPIAAGGQ